MARGLSTCGMWVLSHFSHVRFFATPWTVACQGPLFMGFSWQEYRSGLPCHSPEDLPDPGVEPTSPVLEGGFLTTELPGKFPGCFLKE